MDPANRPKRPFGLGTYILMILGVAVVGGVAGAAVGMIGDQPGPTGLAVMGGHASSVGKALTVAVERYNQFVGSLESQVMVSARRFEDLQVDHEGKDLPGLPPVETTPRSLSRPELAAPAAGIAAE